MSEAHELLAMLRDIGEPAPPEGSPPLLILANLVLVLLIACIVARRVRRRRRAWLDEALVAVRAARTAPPAVAHLALATLLRRLMRHRHGESVDALQGETWLARLDEEFGGDWFTRGAGQAFGEALYAPLVRAGTSDVSDLSGSSDSSISARLDTDLLCDVLTERLKRLPHEPRSRPVGHAADGAPAPDATGSPHRADIA